MDTFDEDLKELDAVIAKCGRLMATLEPEHKAEIKRELVRASDALKTQMLQISERLKRIQELLDEK